MVRNALPSYRPPVSPEELAGLALEDEVEARVVREQRGSFRLSRGPFSEAFFRGLPATHWTVLVQDLDQHIPEVARLFGLVDFLPSYRLDDIMASYAAPYGSVGPHFDHYDVFLIQVSGRRRWQLTKHFARDRVRQDSELSILAEFTPEADWVLEPGDMLYLPPSVAHYGVALEPCVTYSLGCRAPSFAEVATHLVRDLIDETSESVRYEDPDLVPSTQPHTLDDDAVDRFERMLATHLRAPRDRLRRSLAALLTQPKALFARDTIEPLSRAALTRTLSNPRGLVRRKGSRWLLCPTSRGTSLFVDGTEFEVLSAARDTALRLCGARAFDARWVKGQLDAPASKALFERLVAAGFLEAQRRTIRS